MTDQDNRSQVAAGKKVKKLIVAVHGIGDQFQFATIQTVANRFCSFASVPEALPLGRFYDETIGQPPQVAYMSQIVLDKISSDAVGFVEVYWADIPRIPENEGYTLEESKKWGKTVIDRLRPQSKADPKTLSPNDLEMAKGLLEEMLDTLTVLDRLMLIADKAGLFKFDLQKILIKYLGDVQLVADFKKYRDKILHRFFEVMNYLANFAPQAEIYIVAHSEGTVVAFLSLLEAIRNHVPVDAGEATSHNPALTCEWVKQVRGMMTIGSPIDKHLVLWRHLWTDFETSSHPIHPPHKIRWRNYYDYGDPIGFELNVARKWLCDHSYQDIFEFPESHDHGFGRYWFPGQAHNDYWEDSEVFSHFIETVVKAPPLKTTEKTDMCSPAPPRRSRKDQKSAPPGNKPVQQAFCNSFPYLLVVGLIFLGIYFVHKAVNEYADVEESTGGILRNVAGMTSIIFGLTIVAQVPRLTRDWLRRLIAVAMFALSVYGYAKITCPEVRNRLGCFLFTQFPFLQSPTGAVIVLASVIAAVVFLVGTRWPRGGLRILLGLGVIGLIFTVSISFQPNSPCALPIPPPEPCCHSKTLWPMFLATAGFLYLWWLAALIFDMAVVWHYYIRNSQTSQRLRELYQTGKSVERKQGLDRPTVEA